MADVARVQFDFIPDRKSAVSATEDGDLIIEGLASDWMMDRMDEAFEPGAFDAGMKAFMDTNPILCYHHQYDKALGQVLEMKRLPEGLWVRARVDKPAPGSWAEDIFAKIKRGTIRAFSVGGRWHRRKGPDGQPRIYKADMAELSVTPLGINPRTLFAVAGKAFSDENVPVPPPAELDDSLERLGAIFDSLAEGKSFKSAAKRRELAAKGHALPDGSYPIENCSDLSNAVKLIQSGHGNVAAAKRLCTRRKRELNCPTELPW